MRQFIQI